MDSLIEQMLPFYDQINQPIVILMGEQAVYQNPAAQELLPSMRSEVLAELTEGTMSLDNRQWDVSIQPVADFRLVTFRPLTQNNTPLPTQLLDVLSHTLRLPLTNAMLVAQMLLPKLDLQPNPRLKTQISALNRSHYQLLRQISNLSDLSLLLENRLVLQCKQVDVTQWMEELSNKLSSLTSYCNLSLRVEAPDKSCMMWVDIDLIERALLNLVSNALKYANKDSVVTIRMDVNRSHLRFKVTDNGAGIDPGKLNTIFEHWQAGNSMKDPHSGAGLGLQLVHQIAKLHGGVVIAERRAKGGTVITLSVKEIPPAPSKYPILRSPPMEYKLSGGFDPVLIELSDALPMSAFQPRFVNE